MKENSRTEKKPGTGIDTGAFIRQVSVAGMTSDIPPAIQPVPNENEVTEEQEIIQPEKQSTKRRKNQNSIDYPAVFLCRYELKSRQGIYIEKETNETIKRIVHNIGDERLTVSGFIENVLKHHFELYKDEINDMYESKFSKPIK
jgi:putative cell wall-binding protein